MDDDNTAAPQDDAQDDQGMLDKLKDAIPGSADDAVIDGVANAAGKVGDMASAASGKVSGAADAVTDKIPGELDDKLVDGARDLLNKASDLADKVTGSDSDGDDAASDSEETAS